MKVALVHDYLKEYGGAERVLEALHEIWPDAPVFTSLYIPDDLGPHKGRFEDWDIRTSIAQFLPFKEKLISPLRLIAPLLFRQFDFSKFDVVIVSATGAYMPNVISNIKYQISNKQIKDWIHVCYCHTPPRYLYGYATAREWKNKIVFRILGELANHFLRLVDFKSAQNVDYFIANSEEVRERIRKFYKREAVVIYPPVSRGPVPDFPPVSAPSEYSPSANNSVRAAGSPSIRATPRSYFLAGGRLARAKHTDLIVKACEKLGVPLKVFGKGFGGIQNSELRIKNKKIELLGEVKDEEKFELMRNAKAYIFASEDEDFGITPVEAMSVGTPVIAYKSGGVVESVIDGKTGIFFDELSVGSLTKAINKLDNKAIKKEDCIKQAEKFNKERFKREILRFIKNCHSELVSGSRF